MQLDSTGFLKFDPKFNSWLSINYAFENPILAPMKLWFKWMEQTVTLFTRVFRFYCIYSLAIHTTPLIHCQLLHSILPNSFNDSTLNAGIILSMLSIRRMANKISNELLSKRLNMSRANPSSMAITSWFNQCHFVQYMALPFLSTSPIVQFFPFNSFSHWMFLLCKSTIDLHPNS